MPKSSDEILEEIRQAKINLEDEKGGYYHLIDLYRKLRQQLRKEKDRDAAADVEHHLVYYLVEYGSYMKMMHEKKDNEAMDALKKALHFDRVLPLAYYRLGFLFYSQRRFAEAGNHFSKALEHQERAKRFRLNERQLYYAHLYLINSELHVVHDTQKRMENLALEGKHEPLESAELSNLYDRMTETDEYLKNHAFIKRTNEGKMYISKKEADEIMIEDEPGVLYLYFGDRTIDISYDGELGNLNKDNGEILFYLLLHSKSNPLDKWNLGNILGEWGEVKQTVLRQRVSRLNQRLLNLGVKERIESENQNNKLSDEHRYFFDPIPPYVIIHRADESFRAFKSEV
ncbi:hypothetical protein U0355_01470 [Salimicrobium sp. PL1-032A]|uniref:hypothetical protein n=1 Tax=Salimicrobium sp. PL1-032A TaxID=3095364 RepID=UPI0032600FF5